MDTEHQRASCRCNSVEVERSENPEYKKDAYQVKQDIVDVVNRRVQTKNGPFNGKGQDRQGIVVSDHRIRENVNNIVPVEQGSIGVICKVVIVIPIDKFVCQGRNKSNEGYGQDT